MRTRRRNNIAGKQSPSGDNVVAIPDRSAGRPGTASEKPADGVAAALLDIKLADRKFESDHFLSGARSAYEIIVTAFAAGNRQTLRPLLSDEVYGAFDGVIHGHEERKEKVDFTFVGFSDAKITHAELKNRMAEITVTFRCQIHLDHGKPGWRHRRGRSQGGARGDRYLDICARHRFARSELDAYRHLRRASLIAPAP